VNDGLRNEARNEAGKGKRLRRRRSWYRRRLRRRRIAIAVVFATVLAGACWQSAARLFSPHFTFGFPIVPEAAWQRGNVHKNLAWAAAQSAKPKRALAIPSVYPYSVVPGGVRNAGELRDAAARDSVVRRHFSGFDFNRAQLIRASEAREVYLSYRIRDTVFWTRKKIRLHVGELLLSDGKITARAHCGNQISDTAKPEVSEEEPKEDVLEQPVAVLASPLFPLRPMLSGPELPAGSPMPPKFFGNGFVFPLIPLGAPLAGGGHCEIDENGDCSLKHHHHKHPHHPIVPEPSTTVLALSGLGLIFWSYRRVARAKT